MPKKITPESPPDPPGRIPAASAKSRSLTIRLTLTEDAEIRAAAAEAQLTLTDFLVSRALHHRRLAAAVRDGE